MNRKRSPRQTARIHAFVVPPFLARHSPEGDGGRRWKAPRSAPIPPPSHPPTATASPSTRPAARHKRPPAGTICAAASPRSHTPDPAAAAEPATAPAAPSTASQAPAPTPAPRPPLEALPVLPRDQDRPAVRLRHHQSGLRRRRPLHRRELQDTASVEPRQQPHTAGTKPALAIEKHDPDHGAA